MAFRASFSNETHYFSPRAVWPYQRILVPRCLHTCRPELASGKFAHCASYSESCFSLEQYMIFLYPCAYFRLPGNPLLDVFTLDYML